MVNGREMEDRLTEFAVTVMELYDRLPKTFLGRLIGQQLLRAGTAVAANNAEVRGADAGRISFTNSALCRRSFTSA